MNTLIDLPNTNLNQGVQIKVVRVEEEGARRHARRKCLSIHQVLMIFLVVSEVTKKQAFSTQVMQDLMFFIAKSYKALSSVESPWLWKLMM
jgi:hypothetical protein